MTLPRFATSTLFLAAVLTPALGLCAPGSPPAHVLEAEAMRVDLQRSDLEATRSAAIAGTFVGGGLVVAGGLTALVGGVIGTAADRGGLLCMPCGPSEGNAGVVAAAVGGSVAGVGLITLLIAVPTMLSSQRGLNHLPPKKSAAAAGLELVDVGVAATEHGARASLGFAF